MTDDSSIEQKESETKEQEAKTFTQADVDEIVRKRLAEEKARQEKAEQKRAEQQAEAERLAGLQGEERVKAEYDSRMKAKEDELNDMKRQLAMSRAESMLSAQGLPTELASNVIGEDDEKTKANIDALSKSINAVVNQRVSDGLSHGTPATGGNPSEKDALASEFDRLMGMQR